LSDSPAATGLVVDSTVWSQYTLEVNREVGLYLQLSPDVGSARVHSAIL
jgi:hypothetical protein